MTDHHAPSTSSDVNGGPWPKEIEKELKELIEYNIDTQLVKKRQLPLESCPLSQRRIKLTVLERTANLIDQQPYVTSDPAADDTVRERDLCFPQSELSKEWISCARSQLAQMLSLPEGATDGDVRRAFTEEMNRLKWPANDEKMNAMQKSDRDAKTSPTDPSSDLGSGARIWGLLSGFFK